MAEKTAIGWTDKTFNHVRGCLKVSEACQFCYADAFSNRNPKVLGVFGTEASGGTRVVAAEKYWREPIKWDGIAQAERNLFDAVSESMMTTEMLADQFMDGDIDLWLNEMAERGIVEQLHHVWYPLDYHAPRVFCASLADVFEAWDGPMLNHKGERLYQSWVVGDPWVVESKVSPGAMVVKPKVTMQDVRDRLFGLIDQTPNLDWQLLTKRPENIHRFWRRKIEQPSDDWCNAHLDNAERNRWFFRSNVLLGTTVENQKRANERIPHLIQCHDLAPVTFLSCEPLLGPVDLRQAHLMKIKARRVGWVIAGAESGPNRRETKLEWVRDLRDQCKAVGVAFFVKQLEVDGKVTANASEFPEDLQIQEFPE